MPNGPANAMRARRIIRRIGAVVGFMIVVAAMLVGGTAAWLYATPPQPRAVAGWSVGPSMPGARGELATAVAYSEPCAKPPFPGAERLYVLGGLSGLFHPEDRVSVYDPNRKLWSAGPRLPARRHHFDAVGLGQAVYV